MYGLLTSLLALSFSITPLLAEEEAPHDIDEAIALPSTQEDALASCFFPCQVPPLPPDCYVHPSSFCVSCQRSCSHFYVGLEGGWGTRLSSADKSTGVGAFFNAEAEGPRADSGYHVGASLGYRWSCLLRTDLSYTYLHPNHYNWTTSFSGNLTEPFKANLCSHLLLFNTYVHLNALYCLFPWLDPYISGGVGVAINRLDNIREFPAVEESQGPFFARIQSHTQTHFGARLGIGAMKYFCRCWIVDLGFNANYIGRVRSGSSRTFVSTGASQSIGKYDFKNNWIGTFYLGLKYAF